MREGYLLSEQERAINPGSSVRMYFMMISEFGFQIGKILILVERYITITDCIIFRHVEKRRQAASRILKGCNAFPISVVNL